MISNLSYHSIDDVIWMYLLLRSKSNYTNSVPDFFVLGFACTTKNGLHRVSKIGIISKNDKTTYKIVVEYACNFALCLQFLSKIFT